MKLTNLFECRFQGGRAASAPQRREGQGHKVTMASADDEIMNTADETGLLPGEHPRQGIPAGGEYHPILPHLVYSKEELDELYPPLAAPEAVDHEDPLNDENDSFLKDGMKMVKDFVSACSTNGRRRRSAD